METKDVYRVEVRYLPKTEALRSACLFANNVYNQLLYINRQRVAVEKVSILKSTALERQLKEQSKQFPEYNNLQHLPAQTVQQIRRVQEGEWSSFYQAIKEYQTNPSKFTGSPKLPKYKEKHSEYRLILTNQMVTIVGNHLVCRAKNKVDNKPFFEPICLSQQWSDRKLREVRICPVKGNDHFYKMELIYQKTIKGKEKSNFCRVLSIDLGLNNLCTITGNMEGFRPLLINGRGLKSQNLSFHYNISHLQSIAKKTNDQDTTKQIRRLFQKRSNVMRNAMHQTSAYIKKLCLTYDVDTIFIGHNKQQKQTCKIKHFVQVPIFSLIPLIRYKCEEIGVRVIELSESYTSGTSFLDRESPSKENYDISRRVSRGLFVTNDGVRMNADVNASLQIMKRGFAIQSKGKTTISNDVESYLPPVRKGLLTSPLKLRVF